MKGIASVREKAVAENWSEMPKGPLTPKQPGQENQVQNSEAANNQWQSS